jgi:Tol biopolymer transport system component
LSKNDLTLVDVYYRIIKIACRLAILLGEAGIYRLSIKEILTDVKFSNSNLPVIFSLSQNYPNPFNPTTTVNFSVPKSGFVTIKLYDILGKQVATLINDNKPAGNYSVKFDGSKLVSGVYFYRMETGSFSQSRKLLLLK